MPLPQAMNQRWSLDFISDALACARRFRVLAVVDDFTRECLAPVADTSLSGLRVGREPDRLAALHDRPATIISDNGTGLTSRAPLRWQRERGVAWHCIGASAEMARFTNGGIQGAGPTLLTPPRFRLQRCRVITRRSQP